MQTNLLQENMLTQNFVSPKLCELLCQEGLTPNTCYSWRMYDDKSELSTDCFDPDMYYKNALPYLHHFNAPLQIIPAYSIRDVERMLPCGYMLQLNGNCMYELMVSDLYKIEPVQSVRMADVFAIMAMKLIKARSVSIDKINIIISAK